MGCQTSTGFVATAAAAAKAAKVGKAALEISEGKVEKKVVGRVKRARVAAAGMDAEVEDEDILDNPTPAMVEVEKKRGSSRGGNSGGGRVKRSRAPPSVEEEPEEDVMENP